MHGDDFYGYDNPNAGSSYAGHTYGNSYAGGTNGSAYGGWTASNPLSGNNAFSGNQGSLGMGPDKNSGYDPKLGMKDGGSHNMGGGGSSGAAGWNLSAPMQIVGGSDSGSASAVDKGGSAGTTPTTGFNYTIPNNMPPFKAPEQAQGIQGNRIGPGITEYNFPPTPQDPMKGVNTSSPDGNSRLHWQSGIQPQAPGAQVGKFDPAGGAARPPFLQGGTADDRMTGRWDTRDNFIQGTGRDASELNQMYPHGLFPDAIDKGSGLANDYSDPKYGQNYMPQGGSFADKFGDADAQQVARNHAQQKAGNYDPEFFRDSQGPGPREMSPQKEAYINAPKSQRDAYWAAAPSDRGSIQDQMMGRNAGTDRPGFIDQSALGRIGNANAGDGITGSGGRQTQLNRGDNMYSGTTVNRMFPPDNGNGHQSQVSSSAGIRAGYTPQDWRQEAQKILQNWRGAFSDGATGQILPPQYAPQQHAPGQNYPDPILAGQIEALLARRGMPRNYNPYDPRRIYGLEDY